MLFGCRKCPSMVNRSFNIIVGKHQQLVSSKNRSLLLVHGRRNLINKNSWRKVKPRLNSPFNRGKSGSCSLWAMKSCCAAIKNATSFNPSPFSERNLQNFENRDIFEKQWNWMYFKPLATLRSTPPSSARSYSISARTN